MTDYDAMHAGRSWSGTPLEDACPCPKKPCGLVAYNEADPDCVQHGRNHPAKTMRQGHTPDRCKPRMDAAS
jgi:hypothetical protein